MVQAGLPALQCRAQSGASGIGVCVFNSKQAGGIYTLGEVKKEELCGRLQQLAVGWDRRGTMWPQACVGPRLRPRARRSAARRRQGAAQGCTHQKVTECMLICLENGLMRTCLKQV